MFKVKFELTNGSNLTLPMGSSDHDVVSYECLDNFHMFIFLHKDATGCCCSVQCISYGSYQNSRLDSLEVMVLTVCTFEGLKTVYNIHMKKKIKKLLLKFCAPVYYRKDDFFQSVVTLSIIKVSQIIWYKEFGISLG